LQVFRTDFRTFVRVDYTMMSLTAAGLEKQDGPDKDYYSRSPERSQTTGVALMHTPLSPSTGSAGVILPCSRGSRSINEKVRTRASPPNEAATISLGLTGLRATLIALASLTGLAVSDSSGAGQLDPQDMMVQEYQSFCRDYYTPTQCAGAIRFILRTSGPEYFAYLHNDQSMDGFLDRLASAVKGGEALRAKEALAVKAGD
jgi:hypothetical protein